MFRQFMAAKTRHEAAAGNRVVVAWIKSRATLRP